MTSARPLFDSPAPKGYATGTTRTRAPAETLALIEPLVARFGVTRLANITGLDRIGIPVYQAVRPNARSLSVSQGKGLDAPSAQVSALMESLESYHAEHARCAVRLESQRALAREARVADPTRLPLARGTHYQPDAPLPWTAARDLRSDEPVFVPFEIVHANFTVPRVPGSGAFSPSTSGLGSGNHIAEATLHGICELIERDAETLWRIAGGEAGSAYRVAPESIDYAPARALVERFKAAGLDVMIWDMTSDVQVAAFSVIVFDPESDADLNPSPAADGSGAHPDRDVALCRALTEAAQSRLTAIAGSRDDFTLALYQGTQRAEVLDHFRTLARAPAERSFEEVPVFRGESIDDDLEHVLDRLAGRGMSEVLVIDLSSPELAETPGLRFARTVVVGLETSIASPSYAPRERALARLAALEAAGA
ncbi:MAG: YcaO-like family protein [Myxococcales bacterium]|nr:YcaO-like family protein [Myxococcales bacterium]